MGNIAQKRIKPRIKNARSEDRPIDYGANSECNTRADLWDVLHFIFLHARRRVATLAEIPLFGAITHHVGVSNLGLLLLR